MKLFQERCLRQWHGIARFVKQYVDGVMWVYILIAGLIACYALIAEIIVKHQYGILMGLPSNLLLFILLTLSSLFTSRLFIEEADKLFLLRNKNLYKKLKRSSYLYSILSNSIVFFVLYCLLFELFHSVHGFASIQMGQLFLGMLLTSLICDQLWIIWRKWLRLFLHVLIVSLAVTSVIYANLYIMVVSLCMFIIIAAIVDRLLLSQHIHFERQLITEQSRAQKILTLILQVNPEMQGTKLIRFTKKSPKLFKLLYSHTPNGAVIELILKSMWRNHSHRVKLVQLVGIGITLLFILPLWGQFLVFLVILVAMLQFIDSLAIEIKNHPALKQLSFTLEHWLQAIRVVKIWLLTPVTFVLIILLCMINFS